ncbi:RloB domain-containing protein [bacterium]|nr:RloB domain-containing protein [bacterium]
MSKRSPRDPRKRATQRRQEARRFLIVCEGEKTEPTYFRAIAPASSHTIRVRGKGRGAPKLVGETIRLLHSEGEDTYDEVWCVFDIDRMTKVQFDEATRLARRAPKREISLAYSNPCFELWYLLHFATWGTSTSCDICQGELSKYLGKPYSKREKDLEATNKYCIKACDNAIENAKNLLTRYVPQNPVADNPSTTVHLLVQNLLKI